jgi:hypothetical protein
MCEYIDFVLVKYKKYYISLLGANMKLTTKIRNLLVYNFICFLHNRGKMVGMDIGVDV